MGRGFRPLSAQPLEPLLLRAAFAWVVWISLPNSLPYDAQPAPNGLAQWLDLTALAEPQVYSAARWGCAAALMIYVFGRGMRLVLPMLTLFHTAVFTLKNSQGAIHHSFQIISLILLAQTIVYYWPRLKQRQDIAIYASQQVIAGIYVVAALSKILMSELKWIWDSPNLAVQIIKTNEGNYYNRLDTSYLEAPGFAIAEWICANPWLARPLLGGGLILELFAFLALWNRRWALGIGLGLIAMHEGIHIMMGLHFIYHEYLLLIFLVNPFFWLIAGWQKLRPQTAFLFRFPKVT